MSIEYSEEQPGQFTISEDEAIQRRLAEVGGVLGKWLLTPPGNDPYIASYAQAMIPNLVIPGLVAETTASLLHERPEMGASHLATLTLRAMQKQLITSMGDDYPTALKTPEDWADSMRRVLGNDKQAEEWHYDMHHRDLQTNETNRADAYKVFLSIADRLGRLPNGTSVEVGCSQNLINKKLARHALTGIMRHFGHTDLDMPLPHIVTSYTNHNAISLADTLGYHSLMHEAVEIRNLVGIDRIDPGKSRNWAYLSVYPSEYRDKKRMDDKRELIFTDYNMVHFYQADFGDLEPETFFNEYPDLRGALDCVLFCVSSYQSPEEKRQHMFQKAAAMANEFVVAYETCHRHWADVNRLIMPSDWQSLPYAFRMYILDKRNVGDGWQEFVMSPDTRANKVRLGGAEFVDCYGTSVAARDIIDIAASGH